MMNSFRNILSIAQSHSQDMLAVKKSMLLAKRNYAQLTVLVIKPKATLYRHWLGGQDGTAVPEIEKKIMSLAAMAKSLGVDVQVLSVEDNAISHAVEQQFAQSNYDLLVAEHQATTSELWPFERNDDLHLLDVSPSAVMFVGRHQWRANGHILAAIETEESSNRHQKFNHFIVEKTDEIAKLLLSDCHFVNCYLKSCQIAFDAEQPATQEYLQHLQHLAALVEPYACPAEQLHVEEGIADDVIPQQASVLDANLVVMGCHEHRGLSASIKGHTINYILDKLPCDVLALQPNVH